MTTLAQMNNEKFKLSVEEVDLLKTKVPKRIGFGTFVIGDPGYFEITNEYLLKLNNQFPLEVIIFALFGVSLDDFLASRRIKKYRIYDHVLPNKFANIDPWSVPYDVDFKSDLVISLSKNKKTLPKVNGKPTSVEYYEDKYTQLDNGSPVLDSNGQPITVYDSIVCRIDFDLYYDTAGFIYKKFAKLRWYFDDGTLDDAETHFKDLGQTYDALLDHEARIAEGKIRREAIIDGLQLPVMGMLMAIFSSNTQDEILAIGRDFLKKHDVYFNEFINGSMEETEGIYIGMKTAAASVMKDGSTWLDVDLGGFSPRQYIVSQFNY